MAQPAEEDDQQFQSPKSAPLVCKGQSAAPAGVAGAAGSAISPPRSTAKSMTSSARPPAAQLAEPPATPVVPPVHKPSSSDGPAVLAQSKAQGLSAGQVGARRTHVGLHGNVRWCGVMQACACRCVRKHGVQYAGTGDQLCLADRHTLTAYGPRALQRRVLGTLFRSALLCGHLLSCLPRPGGAELSPHEAARSPSLCVCWPACAAPLAPAPVASRPAVCHSAAVCRVPKCSRVPCATVLTSMCHCAAVCHCADWRVPLC